MTSSSNKLRVWALSIGVALLIGGPIVLSLARRDFQETPPRLAGRLLRARLADTTLVVYMTEEERSKSVLGRSREWRYDPYTRYELAVRRIPDGALVRSVTLADVKRATNTEAPTIIGVVGDVVWLWRDSLEARALTDLSVRASARTLAGTGPESASDVLPREPKSYAILADPLSLVARGRDARFYQIDAAGSVRQVDPSTFPPTTSSTRVEDRFDYLVPPGQSRPFTSPSNILQRSFLTSDGKWYALLSESERAGVSKWPSGEEHPYGEVARSPFRTTYVLDDRRKPEIDIAGLRALGTERLIQAGFLVRYAWSVWDVADPSSSLVLAKDALGSNEPWIIVRLARDGSVVWRTSTEMTEPTELVDLGGYIAFVGPEQQNDVTDRRRQRLVWISERTGARGEVSFATGEVK